jgi:ABC-type glutathione transport system ATPase component
MSGPLLSVEDLRVEFRRGRATPVQAVRGVSFDISPGETLGLVGESGCGKTTLSRAVLGLIPCTGRLRLHGEELDWQRNPIPLRRRLQLIFQDPFASLNPRIPVGRALEEPLIVHENLPAAVRRQRVEEMLAGVQLESDAAGKYPHEFSGGQRQRIAIARALILRPEFVIADEPVSALDVSIQAQILNLLSDLKREMGLTMLFISHDLAVVRHVADRVAVMYRGEVVEIGPASEVMHTPQHPYTRSLLASLPAPRRR